MSDAKQKALEAIFKAVEKKHKGVLTTMAQGKVGLVRGAMSTPLETVDKWLLGVGGFAFERVTEIFGPESSGKSSLVMGALGCVQRAGGIALYVDAENACTQERADVLGVNKEELIMAPDLDNAEQAGQILLDTVLAHRSEVPLLCAYDSIPAMETRAQADGAVGDNHMAPMARFMSGYLPKLIGALRGKNAHVIFVNQPRMKPGVMFGNPEYTPGGNALKFFATTRIRTSGMKKMDGGMEVKIKTVKSKLAEPGRELISFFHFQKGWDNDWTTLNHAKEMGVVANDCRNVAEARVALGWAPSEEEGKKPKGRGKKEP